MAIEFQCPHCRALLRVEDGARGKKAECPQCGQVSQLPTAIASPPPVAAAAPLPFPSAEVGVPLTKGPLFAARIDLGMVISHAWNALGRQYGISLGASLLFFFLSFAVGTVANMVPDFAAAAGDPVSLTFMCDLGEWVFNTWLTGGMTLFFLKVARGQPADTRDLYAAGRYLWRLLIVEVLLICVWITILVFGAGIPALVGYLVTEEIVPQQRAEDAEGAAAKKAGTGEKFAEGAEPQAEAAGPEEVEQDEMEQWPTSRRAEVAKSVAIIGFVFCLIPLAYVGLMFSQAVNLVVDRQMGAIEALRQSMRITRGNKLSLLVLGLLAFVVSVGGILACCIGIIFVLPFGWMLNITAYLAMTSQLTEI
jgi:predicted Zn finger-like uncharacterized protein